MKAGRPTLMDLNRSPCSSVVQELINGERPPSTVAERRLAARLLREAGVERRAIASLLGVNVKTINRYAHADSA